MATAKGKKAPARKKDDGFSERIVLAMVNEMVQTKYAFDRSYVLFATLAKQHGIKMPKPERSR